MPPGTLSPFFAYMLYNSSIIQENTVFTIGDIRNIAVQIERNGEDTYRKAAELVENPDLKELLVWMADQEQKHAKWFTSLESGQTLTAEQQELENVGKNLLQDMIKGSTFLLDLEELKNSSTLKEVLDQAIAFEQDTILFYKFLLGFLDDEETIKQLGEIIEEERSHITQLKQIVSPLNC